MAPDAVHRNAEDLGIKQRELRKQFVVERELVAADGAPVSGITDENDGTAAEFR